MTVRPIVVDRVLAGLALGTHLPIMVWKFWGDGRLWWLIPLDIAVCAVLVLRRRYPVAVLVTTLAVADALIWTKNGGGQNIPAILLALYTMCLHLRARWAFLLTAATLVVGVLIPPPTGKYFTPDVMFTVMAWVWMFGMAGVLGQIHRHSRRRARRLEQALEMLDEAHQRLAEEAVVVERNRIAREMHDIVAHGLSVIAVRAGVARTLLPTDPGQVAESIGVIETVSRESLGEMRTMLGVLRSSDEDSDGRPQPGLDRLPELVERARESGLELDAQCVGEPRALPPGQELVAYRIVQEALTNVLKHAGQVRATASLTYLPDRVIIEVFNEVPCGPVPATVRSGHGLVGMRERVGMYGGVVTAQPVDGGFRVRAELPVEA